MYKQTFERGQKRDGIELRPDESSRFLNEITSRAPSVILADINGHTYAAGELFSSSTVSQNSGAEAS